MRPVETLIDLGEDGGGVCVRSGEGLSKELFYAASAQEVVHRAGVAHIQIRLTRLSFTLVDLASPVIAIVP
jgi:hypothetical protein